LGAMSPAPPPGLEPGPSEPKSRPVRLWRSRAVLDRRAYVLRAVPPVALGRGRCCQIPLSRVGAPHLVGTGALRQDKGEPTLAVNAGPPSCTGSRGRRDRFVTMCGLQGQSDVHIRGPAMQARLIGSEVRSSPELES
jgi:hypothetical protein